MAYIRGEAREQVTMFPVATVPSVVPGLVSCSSQKYRQSEYFERLFGWQNWVGIVTFASPKSKILACPLLSTKMFAGLMSRCTMRSE